MPSAVVELLGIYQHALRRGDAVAHVELAIVRAGFGLEVKVAAAPNLESANDAACVVQRFDAGYVIDHDREYPANTRACNRSAPSSRRLLRSHSYSRASGRDPIPSRRSSLQSLRAPACWAIWIAQHQDQNRSRREPTGTRADVAWQTPSQIQPLRGGVRCEIKNSEKSVHPQRASIARRLDRY